MHDGHVKDLFNVLNLTELGLKFSGTPTLAIIRVVQIQIILFLKSMSERGGSDREQLWIWRKFNRFWVDLENHHSNSESFYVGFDLFRHLFQKVFIWLEVVARQTIFKEPFEDTQNDSARKKILK